VLRTGVSTVDLGKVRNKLLPMSNSQDFCFIRSMDFPDGEILPRSQIRISPDDRGFYFADGVYEVMRTYSGKIFRQSEHLKRFEKSLSAVRINVPDIERIGPICEEFLHLNNLQGKDVFFYIQATRGVWQRSLVFPPAGVIPTLYISVTEIVAPVAEQENGIRAITVEDIRWQRCDIKAIGLLPSVLARNQATEAGAEEAIFVRNGLLTEGTHTNLFAVKDGVVFTHPLNNYILPGITRTVVLELCNFIGLEVNEEAIELGRLGEFDELFVTSTTYEVVPVVVVNGQKIRDGKPGEITRRLQGAFRDYIARG